MKTGDEQMQKMVQMTEAEYEAMQEQETELVNRVADLERILTWLALQAGGELNLEPLISINTRHSLEINKEGFGHAPRYKVTVK